ncbi:MAG: methylated-DNA--[protein]-cysteine S-methyltransferase [Cytophagales bacterium]|nr:methylated-DNA--[protein]-cysteine S-methyltransferase [Cytophagales bacterium]
MSLHISLLNTPIGWLEIKSQDDAISSILFKDKDFLPTEKETSLVPDPKSVEICKTELLDYFSGNLTHFTSKIIPSGTDFQKRVWKELQSIPFGETISYEKLSIQLGDVKAIRAVAAANGQNPLMILCPCHRVIGKKGELTGYAGGIWRKQWLLDHEAKLSGKRLTLFD